MNSPFKASTDEDGFFKRIGVIGIGLIGGSLAKAIHRLEQAELYGVDASLCNRQRAVESGIFTSVVETAKEIPLKMDLLILAVPLGQMQAALIQAAPLIGPSTLITDVGSVKAQLCGWIAKTQYAKQFIGGHPMAGSEKNGFKHAEATLFEGAKYFLCPPEKTAINQGVLDRFYQLIVGIGALPVFVTPQKHDALVASLSHLPHLTACALVSTLVKKHSSEAMGFAGNGFKDMTRIAMSDAALWQDIFSDNKYQLVESIDLLVDELDQLKNWIIADQRGELIQVLGASKEARALLK